MINPLVASKLAIAKVRERKLSSLIIALSTALLAGIAVGIITTVIPVAVKSSKRLTKLLNDL